MAASLSTLVQSVPSSPAANTQTVFDQLKIGATQLEEAVDNYAVILKDVTGSPAHLSEEALEVCLCVCVGGGPPSCRVCVRNLCCLGFTCMFEATVSSEVPSVIDKGSQ